MKGLVSKLLALTAFAGAMASVQAQQTFDLGTLAPSVQTQTDFFATSGASFADIFNFTVGANYHQMSSSAAQFTPSGTDASQTHVSNLKIELFAGSGATGSLLDTVLSLDGALINLNQVLATGSYSARVSGLADGGLGGGFQFSVAANPEPAEWMMLACGLLVMGFIARRKIGLLPA